MTYPAVNTNTGRLSQVTLDCETLKDEGQSLLADDRRKALDDLAQDSFFQPKMPEAGPGPYALSLAIEENRMVIRITDAAGQELPMLVLSLKPYRRIIKDYFMIVRSYQEAVLDGHPSRIEAVDMGRRGLHNEGAALLMERLQDKIEIDEDTARRLFTLICVLHAGRAVEFR